jgi:hypothetical protein
MYETKARRACYQESNTRLANSSSNNELPASEEALLAMFDGVGAAFAAFPIGPFVDELLADVELVVVDPEEPLAAPERTAAPFSAIAYVGEVRCAASPTGIIEESMTRRLLIPYTLSCSSTTPP